MAITDGMLLRVYHGSTPTALAKETSSSFKLSVDLKEVIHKDQDTKWVERRPGKISAEVSGENLYAEGEGYETINAAMLGKTNLALTIGDKTTSGSKVWRGNFLFTSLDENNPDGDNSTYSYTAKNDGALTYTT